MPTNDFVPFGTSQGANVYSVAAYAASTARQVGVVDGEADPKLANNSWRQGTVMASMLGSFMVAQGYDAFDDGNLTNLLTNFTAALNTAVGSAVPSRQRIHFGVDTGTPNRVTANVAPDIVTYEAGAIYWIVAGNAPTGPAIANLDGRGDRNIVRRDGSAVQAGDWAVGEVIELRDDGAKLQLANWTQSAAPPPVALWHSGTATGPISALSVTLAPAISSYEDRLPVFINFPSGVSTGATIALNGLPPIPLQRNDGTPIQGSDIPPSSFALFGMVGTGALRLTSLGRGEVQRISINPVLYVRTDGNDNNDGLTNTAGGAFATIAAALAKGTSQYNFSSSALTIRLGNPGTYVSPGQIPRASGTINITGDASNQTAYTVSGSAAPGFGCIQTSGPLVLTGLVVQNTGTQSHGVAATGTGTVVLINTHVVSTQTTSGNHLFAVDSSIITVGGGCVLQGNASAAFCGSGGLVSVNPSTSVFIFGTPTFSVATAFAANGGKVTLLSGASVGGAANGLRYNVQNYSIINTSGGGENAFPGTSPGFVSNALYL